MKKILSVVLAIVMSASMLGTLFAYASPSDTTSDLPFTDVTTSDRYYEAVKFVYGKKLFAGISDTEFAPHGEMNRAMIVTVLSRLYEVDRSEYEDKTSFDDVPVGQWYSASVEWAYRNDIVTGRGNGIFDPMAPVTRQEASLIFFKYAELKGLDTSSGSNTFMYSRMTDKKSIESWAADPMKWAITNGLMFNKGNDGTNPLAAPASPATRSDVAYFIFTMLSTLDGRSGPVKSLKINGNDITLYKIIIAKGAKSVTSEAADEMQLTVKRMTGINLPIADDSTEPSEYEIVLGKTSREDAGLVTVDRSDANVQGFTATVQGSRLVIAGNSEERKDYQGTFNGVVGLAEEAFGFRYIFEDTIILTPSEEIDLPDGYSYSDGPGIPNDRRGYTKHLWDNRYNRDGDIYSVMYMEHNMGEVITGNHNYDLNGDTPCMTDPDNIASAVAYVKNDLDKRKAKGNLPDAFVLCQNDSIGRCRCENCMKLTRENGARSAPIIYFCNKVLEGLEPDYPDIKLFTAAYMYSVNAPKVLKPNRRIIVKYCTIDDCASHAYTDPNCPLNAEVCKNLKDWAALLDELYVWDYCANFTYTASMLPMFDVLRENYNFYKEVGVKGIFINGTGGSYSPEFEPIRGFLIGRLTWDPGMTEETYSCYLNSMLWSYYGQGWSELREFIDLVEILSNRNCFGFHTYPTVIISDADVISNMGRMNALMDAAEAAAETQEQLDRVQLLRLCLIYTVQNATYKLYMTHGTDEQKAAYVAQNQYLHSQYKRYNVEFSETEKVPDTVDYYQPPCNWK